MPRAVGPLVLALMLAAPCFALEALPAPWDKVGLDPTAVKSADHLLRRERLRGPYEDLSPVAHALLDRAAEAASNRADALESLALAAAPHDPNVSHRLAESAFRNHRWGTGLAGSATTVFRLLLDPWGQLQLALQVGLALCLAGWAVAFAIGAWGLVARAGLAYHDYADVFPWRLRRFTPAGLAALTGVVLTLGGVGPGLFLWAIGLLLAAYLPPRGRWALGFSLLLGALLPLCLSAAARTSGPAGARAWALYRVTRGGGPATGRDLERLFGADEPRALYARARIRRRGGDLVGAEALIRQGLERGGDGGVFSLELGNLRFLQGDLSGALAQYERATGLRPKDPLPWFDRHVALLANLDLDEADAALDRAKALAGDKVDRYQRALPDGSAELAPISDPLPKRWLVEAFLGEEGPATGPGASRVVVPSSRWVPPWVIGVVGFLVAVVSGWVGRGRRSHRCPGCGSTVCPRCGYRVKASRLCAACWATREEAEPDRNERDRQRQATLAWHRKARRWTRWSRLLLPGWSDFLCDAPKRGAVVATLWSLGVGWAVAGWVRPVPFFAGLPVVEVGGAAVLCAHLWGGWRALRTRT